MFKNSRDICLAAESIASILEKELDKQKFWNCFSYLIEKRDDFSDTAFNCSTSDIIQYLQTLTLNLGIDPNSFLQEFVSQQPKDNIVKNIEEVINNKIYEIPTIIINDVKQQISNISEDSLISLIYSPQTLPDSIDSVNSITCTIYSGFMIIFLIIGILLVIIIIVMCVNCRVKSIETKFDPGKMWETVTIGNLTSAINEPDPAKNNPNPNPTDNRDEIEIEIDGQSQSPPDNHIEPTSSQKLKHL